MTRFPVDGTGRIASEREHPTTVLTGPAGGDLAGSYPNPTVTSSVVSGASLPPTFGAGQVPKWSGGKWVGATSNRVLLPGAFGARLMMAGIGDSLIAHLFNPITGDMCDLGWLWWAQFFSEGRIRLSGIAAHGSYTSTQVKTDMLPLILAASPLPDACMVLAGTNDLLQEAAYGADLSATHTALLSCYTQLSTAGIVPVACTIPATVVPATEGSTDPTDTNNLNAWIRETAVSLGIPLLDFYTDVTADPNNQGIYRPGLHLPDVVFHQPVHPNAAGAQAMGQYVANQLAPLTSPSGPPVAIRDDDPVNLIINPLFAGTSGSLPDGWTVDVAGTGVTHSLIADPEIAGNWWRIQKSVSDESKFNLDLPGALTAGHLLRFSCRVKINSVDAEDGTSGIYIAVSDNTNAVFLSPGVWQADGVAQDTGYQYFDGPEAACQGVHEVECIFAVSARKPRIFVRAGSTVDFQVAQMTLQVRNSDDTPIARTNPRVVAVTQAAQPAIDTNITDVAVITNLLQAITSMTTNLTGTPADGDTLLIRISDSGAPRAIAWGGSFEGPVVALPTTTVAGVMLVVEFVWNPDTSKWRCVGVG